uniref:Ion transport domain-containing protein n=4 Tax=Hemiselmis andersenii TaxID=464988 RepID=A0A7S1HM23_HEMAN|mmetsp:Transcript_7434/g.18014  ORF Transcript_7434/g.18014 Transcript_7434/m.18014 type:complete len:803 (+) Transcript_7434:422-2830(+)
MVRTLKNSIRTMQPENKMMPTDPLDFNLVFRRATDRQKKKLRERQAEAVLEMEVMEMVFTLLRALDVVSPFLHKEILSLEQKGLSAAPVHNILNYYKNTAGSVEILRNNRVEKYVFRYNPAFSPADFSSVIDIESIMQEILMASRLSSPQRRLTELVRATVNMHFELQLMRTVDSWPRLGPTLRRLRYQSKNVEIAAFMLVVLLNIVLLFAYFYREEDLERLTSQAWNVTSHGRGGEATLNGQGEDQTLPYVSAGLKYLSYNRELDMMVITAILSVILLPLHLAILIEYLCYSLPVKLNKRYSREGKMPELSIFDGRIDKGINLGLSMRNDKNSLHTMSTSAATSAQEHAVKAVGWRVWVYKFIDQNEPTGGAWTFLMIVLTMFEIIISAMEDFYWNDPVRDEQWIDMVALVDWVCIAIFLLDLAIRVWCIRSEFFFTRERVKHGTVQRFERRWRQFNIFDASVVLAWAALTVVKEFQPISSSLTSCLLWLRMARVVRALLLLRKVGKRIMDMGVARDDTSDREKQKKEKGRWSAWFLCGVHVVTDLRFLSILVYIVSTLLATIGVLRHMVNGQERFSVVFNPIWYCIGLVEMVRRMPTIPNVFRAITIQRAQLLQTAALGVYVIYLFGMVAFIFIPVAMSDAHGASCTTGIQCFFLIFEIGLAKSDVSEGMLPIDYEDSYYALYYFFVVAFFILITLVLLNVIFGIIIDSFGQLRGAQEEVTKQMHNECFICGKDRHAFNDPSVNSTFHAHINQEHRVWDYICFIVYVVLKNTTELTGTEQFVIEELRQVSFVSLWSRMWL